MKKMWDKFKSIFTINKKLLVFLSIISVIAIIAGSILVVLLSNEDKTLTMNYINTYFENISNNKLDYVNALKNSLISNILFVLMIWLLGISVIGVPVIIIMYFSKVFTLGFSISTIISMFKAKGCLYAFLYVFPHHIISLITYVYLITYAIAVSIKLLNAFIKKKSIDFKPIINKYKLVLGVSLIIVIIMSLLEIFLSPFLMKFVLKIG